MSIEKGRHEFAPDTIYQILDMWWEFAHLEGWTDREEFDRTEAFGAIRRAAEVARECEATGWEQTTIGLQWAWWNKAKEIRRAIRAAIRSERA